jgi:aminomethyltransferase
MLNFQNEVPMFADSQTVGDTQELYYLNSEALQLELDAGERVEICDIEGDQRCGVLLFDVKSKKPSNSSVLTDCQSVKVSLSDFQDEDFFEQLQSILKKNQLDADNLEMVELSSVGGVAGKTALFEVKQQGIGIVLVFGSSMCVEKQNSPTDIRLMVRRNFEKTDGKEQTFPLPTPLAEPIQEIRVKNSTAESYTVKKGEYIQIIDVEGHQCSDFQCFSVSDLEKGESLGIDPTVTRSIMGSSYPAPGVHDKYYNLDSVPLVEIVRDTVWRHDTFGLACNSKYYEDVGFPGHPNCTDNFNKALGEYDVKPRLNWVAVNFFFNTNIEECHSLSSDVSWSRPGDYVLLRALSDLVCVSSACPDDVSPANDFKPTDIHVRIYGKENEFSQACTLRPTPTFKPLMTKETGFHACTSKLTRNFIDYNGYWLASDYREYGAINEYWACREGVIAVDLSPLRKFEIYGQDAEILMQYALTRNVRKLAVGQVVYSAICYENGGMIDDGTLFRMGDNNFRWICGTDYCGVWLRELAEKMNLDAWVKSSTDQLHNFSVQGPKSRELLKKIIWTSKTCPTMDELGWFRFTNARLHEEKGLPIVISRTGYTGELGYELFVHPSRGEELWQEVFKAGEEFGIAPLGLDALDMVRIEAGLVFAGYEFCDQTDPFEAGIGFTVPLKSKEDDFSGRESIARRKENPVNKLVGLELEGNEVAAHGDDVYIGMQKVGVITSATRSPILKKNIAFCKMSVQATELGTQVEVGKLDGHQKRLPAKVIAFPFYDPEKLRVRS